MPVRQNQVPHGVEAKILALFDETLESSTGNIHYRCGPNRAKYLHRWATFLRDSSAVSSIDTFPRDHPLYGLGVYWNLETIPTKIGLLLRLTDEPHLSPSQLIIRTAVKQKNFSLTCASVQAARNLIGSLSGAKANLHRKGLDPNLTRSVNFYLDGKSVHLAYEAFESRLGRHELTDEEVNTLLSNSYGEDFLIELDDDDEEEEFL